MAKIVVCGAGAFGTALAHVFSQNSNHQITLKSRQKDHAELLQQTRVNERYLNSLIIKDDIHITSTAECVQDADILILATPTQHTPSIIDELKPYLTPSTSIILANKGILEHQTLQAPFISDFLQNSLNISNPIYILSGPNFAKELALDLPAAATLAGADVLQTTHMAHQLCTSLYRLYPSIDIIGVNLAGAIKNIYAIAAGISEGLNLGNNAKAALITRALAETKRLGVAMGASPETFLGLSGVGDLLLSCGSHLSRNMSLGLELAQGKSLQQILNERHTIAEGVFTVKAILPLIKKYQIRMPIALAVFEVLYNNASLEKAMTLLTHNLNTPLESD